MFVSVFGGVALTALLGECSARGGAHNAGRLLGVRQSAESVAGIVAPWLAGRLYGAADHPVNRVAPGALPFVVGAAVQLTCGVLPPLLI